MCWGYASILGINWKCNRQATDDMYSSAIWDSWTITFENCCMAARCLQSRTISGDVCAYHQRLILKGTSRSGNCLARQPSRKKLASDALLSTALYVCLACAAPVLRARYQHREAQKIVQITCMCGTHHTPEECGVRTQGSDSRNASHWRVT